MKYWGLRYVCVDFDPPPPAHLFSAPAPRANSHQSRDFTFLRARDLPSLRFTYCVLLLSQRAVTVHPVLFSLLIYLVSRRQGARQSHSRLRIFLASHQWKRKQVILVNRGGFDWQEGASTAAVLRCYPKKTFLSSIDERNVNFSSIRVRSSVTDDMSAI